MYWTNLMTDPMARIRSNIVMDDKAMTLIHEARKLHANLQRRQPSGHMRMAARAQATSSDTTTTAWKDPTPSQTTWQSY